MNMNEFDTLDATLALRNLSREEKKAVIRLLELQAEETAQIYTAKYAVQQNTQRITVQNEIADALRKLVAEIYKDCKGAYGAGDDGYSGEYELYIQSCAKAIVNVA